MWWLLLCTLFADSSVHSGARSEAEKVEQAKVQLALVRAIPRMAMHQTALPFVQRALLPLSQPGTSMLLVHKHKV